MDIRELDPVEGMTLKLNLHGNVYLMDYCAKCASWVLIYPRVAETGEFGRCPVCKELVQLATEM